MLAEATNPRGEFISSDVLLKGFKLLSVTPKKLSANDTAVDKIYFSKKECDECVKSHARFIAAVREAGRAFAFCLPKTKKYKKARDEAAESHRDSKDRLFNQLFSRVSSGKYRYTGRHYRYLSANPHGIGTVKTPNSKSITDCWEKIPEYFIILAWAEDNSHGSKHKYKNLIESFLDETAKEACSGLLLKSYRLLKQQKEALNLQSKNATPDEARTIDNQVALLDSITGKLSIQLLDWGINPDIADVIDSEAATNISTSRTAEQNDRKPNESSVAKEIEDAQEKTYANPIANEIINDPGCELFNDIEGMRLTGESVVSICEDFSRGLLHEKEFSEVSHTPSLYPYWAMAEGAREIKEIWKLTPFYLGKTDTLPKRTKLLSKYLDWNCNYSFWQAIEKFYRSAIQEGTKYNDSDIMMIHYLGIVYGKSIKLINSLHGRWLEFDLNKLGNHLYALLQSESNDKEFLHDLILQELDVIKKWVKILHDELPEFELARLRGEMPTQSHKESECITMFPFEKKFKLIGQPNFIVPEDKQVALGRQLEKIAKAQEFKFTETTFSAPKYTGGNCDFEYRIQDKIDPDSDHYTINFNYFKSDNTLRIYSCIPAARTMPIVKFIVENYLQVHLGKEISTSYGLDSTPVVFETPQSNIKFQERLYCERFKVSKDFKYIYDSVHTVDNYPLIQNLENTGNKVIEVLKKLFNAYGKKTTSGWVYSGGGAWGPHFAKKPYSLFKTQQIAVRRNPNTNKNEWRIIPLAEFDEESPIGLHSKRKNHSNQKNNF